MSAPTVVRAAAPGRVNLIGEHTDYNGGFVLPTAIPQQTRVVLTPRADRQVHAHTRNARPASASYTLAHEAKTNGWLDYVQGITWVLRENDVAGFEHDIAGFDLDIDSDVPLGSGLSSSAALEIALLRAIKQAFGLQLDDIQMAKLGQRAENDFVGAHCGIMDQMAASLADAQNALFLDTRSLEFRRIPLPPDADLVIIDSGVTHGIVSGEYNARRADCEAAAAQLGVPQLRDLTSKDLAKLETLPPRLHKRARHVITEDDRVLEAVAALEQHDLQKLGELFYASHASMRDDFEVSTPDVDLLVELGRTDPEIIGARLTGGGFGGAVVMLARAGQGKAAGQRVAQAYAQRSSCTPTLLVPN